MMALKVLILGDIVGTAGRQAVAQCLPALRERHEPDLGIANAENASNGSGLTPELYRKLKALNIDGLTLGDHVYKKQQIRKTLSEAEDLIRPANLPSRAAGRGMMRLRVGGEDGPGPSVYVISVLGRVFMNHMPADDPFACVDRLLGQIMEPNPIVLVEVHAEATSEKIAMGWHLNGRVAAVFGTHTHTPTADERVLPDGCPQPETRGGTAYISDLGMCGPYDSVLGRMADRVLTHMTTSMPSPFDVAEGNPRVCGVLVEIDEATRCATRIERVDEPADVSRPPFVAP